MALLSFLYILSDASSLKKHPHISFTDFSLSYEGNGDEEFIPKMFLLFFFSLL